MKVEKLRKKIEELPQGLTVTKVHIETINKHGEPMTIEFEKSHDELTLIRQARKLTSILSFGVKNKNNDV